MAIRIDLGLRKYELQDEDGGTLGTISFNPSDPGMLPRWEEAKRRVTELTAEAANIDSVAAVGDLDKQIKAAIDYAFGSPVSAVVFQNISSLAVCPDGALVVEKVIEALLPVIEEAMKAAAKEGHQRVAKRTGKYTASPAAGLAPGQA